MTSRRLVSWLLDAAATALALVLSFLLRWGAVEFAERQEAILTACALAFPVALASYWGFRLDRSPWRFVSVPDLGTMALAVTAPAMFLVLVDFLSRGALIVPRTVPLIYWLVQLFLLAGPRIAYRAYRSRRNERRASRGIHRIPVLIAGTGDEANQLIARLRRATVPALDPVGLLAGKSRHIGERIQQVPILGGTRDLDEVLHRLSGRGTKPTRIVITQEILRSDGADDLLVAARRAGLQVVRMSDSLTGLRDPDAPLRLAPVSIDDLLGRPPRELDLSPARLLLAGRRVAVTGAGGSIGSELCRQAAALGAAELLLFELSELALWTVAKEMQLAHPDLPVTRHLGSINDAADVAAAFRAFGPHVVFHAAALKHVDIVEMHPVAAALTNTLGTEAIARAAAESGAACSVFISTDKAVDPVSILGATKRAGELVWASQDRGSGDGERGGRFVVVRFGNVLGSSGSVIPLFGEQLKAGGPVTVTHPDVERYFMTVSEAVRLVLLASSLGREARDASPTYVLDMGEPVRIVDLARRMIRLAGMEPDVEIAIAYSGLRPGERLREILETQGEHLGPTAIDGIRSAGAPKVDPAGLGAKLAELRSAVEGRDVEAIRRCLRALVPEYAPAGAGAL